MDPEGAAVDWSVEGTDSGNFDIAGGVLTFKSPPNFEMPVTRIVKQPKSTTDTMTLTVPANEAGNNEYVLTVRATEMQADDTEGNALSSKMDIIVTVTDVNEPGTAEITWRQPRRRHR